MQSDDNLPKDTPTSGTPTSEVAGTPTPTPLRREAMLITTERHRGALIAALCSLAGVGLGFGLSQVATTHDSCLRQVSVQHRAPASVTLATPDAPIAKLTWLGVEGHSMRSYSQDEGYRLGAKIAHVFPGSPAEAAGLQSGDLITSLDGTPVLGFPGLVSAVRSHDKGERVSIGFVDSTDQDESTQVTLGEIARSQFRTLGGR